MEMMPSPSWRRCLSMEKWACVRVRWGKVGERCAYSVVDLAPSLILEVVMFESLQTVDADVEICGVENCD